MSRTEAIGAVATAAAGTAAYNVVLNRLLPSPSHLPANLTAAVTAIVAAGARGLDPADLGIEWHTLSRGVRIGAKASMPVVAAIGAAVALPHTRGFFVDAKHHDTSRAHAAYDVLLRIPLATALFEELIFRGVVYGWLRRHHSERAAIAISSIMFGAWHILPTLDSLHTSAAGQAFDDSPQRRAIAVSGTVAATTAAGVIFAKLRLRAGHVIAPTIVHAVIDAFAAVVSRQVTLHTARPPATAPDEAAPTSTVGTANGSTPAQNRRPGTGPVRPSRNSVG